MPDIYVVNAPISMALLVWLVGVALTYGAYRLFTWRKKR